MWQRSHILFGWSDPGGIQIIVFHHVRKQRRVRIINLNLFDLLQSYDGESQIQLKQEPMDEGPPHHGRNIQKVPSLSDLSDPEASLGK